QEVPGWVAKGGISRADAIDTLIGIGEDAGLRRDVVERIVGTIFAPSRNPNEDDEPTPTGKLNFEVVWFANIERALAEPEWLVDDMLTRGDMSMLYGPSLSGKSFLATDIALSIARGVDFFDRKVIKGAVVYFAAEGRKG